MSINLEDNENSCEVLILMATYNGENFIREQIQSIQAQTYTDWELWFRDDGSTDTTICIIKELAADDDRLKLIEDDKGSLGPCENFSELAQHAKSKSSAQYIAFSDQDDVWVDSKIANVVARMKVEEIDPYEPILIHTDLKVVDVSLNEINKSCHALMMQDPRLTSPNRLAIQCVVVGCTTLMNRQLLELVAPIPKAAYMHDWWVGMVASVFGRVVYLDEVSICYRQHESNCLGVENISVLFRIKKLLNPLDRSDLQRDLNKSILLAKAFELRFGKDIPAEFIGLFRGLSNLNKLGFFEKRYFVLKNNVLRHGFLSNISLLIRM